jgi:hypothetical protein
MPVKTVRDYPAISERMRRAIMSTYYGYALSAVTHALTFPDTCQYGYFCLVLVRGTRTQEFAAPLSYNLLKNTVLVYFICMYRVYSFYIRTYYRVYTKACNFMGV